MNTNLIYLAGCAGVTLAIIMLARGYIFSSSRRWPSLYLPTLVLLFLAWSLTLGVDAGPLFDIARPIGAAWVIHASTHHIDGRGKHHAQQ